MRKKPAFLALALFSLSAPARADVDAGENVVGHFAKSLSLVYAALEACEDSSTFDYKKAAVLIKSYMVARYPGGVPYWVAPALKHADSREFCNYVIEKRMLDYKEASLDFAVNYPDQPLPPGITQASLIRANENSEPVYSLHVAPTHIAQNASR